MSSTTTSVATSAQVNPWTFSSNNQAEQVSELTARVNAIYRAAQCALPCVWGQSKAAITARKDMNLVLECCKRYFDDVKAFLERAQVAKGIVDRARVIQDLGEVSKGSESYIKFFNDTIDTMGKLPKEADGESAFCQRVKILGRSLFPVVDTARVALVALKIEIEDAESSKNGNPVARGVEKANRIVQLHKDVEAVLKGFESTLIAAIRGFADFDASLLNTVSEGKIKQAEMQWAESKIECPEFDARIQRLRQLVHVKEFMGLNQDLKGLRARVDEATTNLDKAVKTMLSFEKEGINL